MAEKVALHEEAHAQRRGTQHSITYLLDATWLTRVVNNMTPTVICNLSGCLLLASVTGKGMVSRAKVQT